MKEPLDPRKMELEPFYQLCWLGFLTVFLILLQVLWNASTDHGRTLSVTITGSALVMFLVAWRVIHSRQKRGQAPLAHETGHIAARDAERFLRMRSLLWTLAWFSLPLLAFSGVLIWGRGAARALETAALLARALVLALALALAWSTLRAARESWRSALPFPHSGLGGRAEARLGLVTAAAFALVWWGRLFVLTTAQHADDLQSWIARGASAWGMWMIYRFFWIRSRALGSRDFGARASGLTSLLYFCLPVPVLILVDYVSGFLTSGREIQHPLLEHTKYALLLVASPLTLVVLFWAAGKVSLVSAKERRRARPSLPLAILSLLGVLVLGGELLFAMVRLGLLEQRSAIQSMLLIQLCVVVTSLGAGMLAHRLAASTTEVRTPGDRDAGLSLVRFRADFRNHARKAFRRKPLNPQMVELAPFYQLCWLGFLTVFLNLMFMLWYMSMGPWPITIATTGSALVMFLLAWRVIHGRQKRRQQERAAGGHTPERPRLQSKLDALRDKLREFSGDDSARLVLLPEPSVVLSTSRSEHEPVVEVTAGFWITYASTPRLMEAALAHEAGHIAARDVERFLRMLSLMRTLAWFSLPVLAFSGVLRWGTGAARILEIAYLLANFLVAALVLALAWSALLVAREIQADAFAVKVLGERRPMEALLESQLSLRAARSGGQTALQRLRTWLIQPNLRWRSTLPFLSGRMGGRVEAKLGLATAAFFAMVWWGTIFVTQVVHDNEALQSWIFKGTGAWGLWIIYRFFWVRSRALMSRDPGARASGLMSLLYFCLPGLTLLLMATFFLLFTSGLPLLESTGASLLFVAMLLTLSVLLWAAGKVSLVSDRERRRERPSLLRAGLSFLGILLPGGGLMIAVSMASSFVPTSIVQVVSVVMPPLVAGGLGTGMLAHYLSTSTRTSAPRAGRALMMEPLHPRMMELEPFYQLCWLGFLTVFLPLLQVLWGASTSRGRTLSVAITGSALVMFLVAWRVIHSRQKREQAPLAHEAGHIAARDAERFLRMRSLLRALAWFSLAVLAFSGVLIWGRGAALHLELAVLVARALILALALALAWSTLCAAHEVQADAFVETKLGLATAAFFTMVWWDRFIASANALGNEGLQSWIARGASVWSSWMAYRFFWARSRALGSRDSGTRSSGLMSLVYFFLPVPAFLLVDYISRFTLGGVPSFNTAYALLFVALLLILAVLLWAAGKVTLVSDRERRRARPSLPRAVLSFLGLLVLGGGLLYLVGMCQSRSQPLPMVLIPLSFVSAGLVAGMLAHRLGRSSISSSMR